MPETQPDPPEESLFQRFLVAHPEDGAPEFERWAREQPEFQARPELLDSVRPLLDRHLQVRRLFPGGSQPANFSIFARRGSGGPSAAPMPGTEGLRKGQRIGHFVLTRFIARGGMGQVWEARDENLRNAVALKLVLPGRIDTRSLELFAREARAGGRLNHPNIVRTLAHGTDEGLAWIAQELVQDSWTLKDFLDDLRAEDNVPTDYYKHLTTFVAEIADALFAAHQAGVIHRDVKPQNILITPDDRPKLTDFGLARVEEDSFQSQSGDFAGTFAYMSPEQMTAKRMGLDHRTDVFSLGIVLYEMLALRRPFEGDTTHQIATQIISHDPIAPSRVRSQCPKELASIVGKALEKDPGRRYQTMGEFRDDLRRHLRNEPIQAKPPGRLLRAVKWARRHPTRSSLMAVVTVALVALSWALNANMELSSKLGSSLAAQKEQTAEANDRANELKERGHARLTTMISKEMNQGNYTVANRWMDEVQRSKRNRLEWRLLEAQLDVSLRVVEGDVHLSSDWSKLLAVHSDGSASVSEWPTGMGIAILRRPGYEIESASISPSGNHVFTWDSVGGRRSIWDATTGQWLRDFDSTAFPVFSPDGTRLLTVPEEGVLRLANVATGELDWEVATGLTDVGSENHLFSEDGSTIAVHGLSFPEASYPTLLVLESETGQRLGEIDLSGYYDLSLSPDGTCVFYGGARWDILLDKTTSLMHGGDVIYPTFSADGRFMAAMNCTEESGIFILVFNCETGRVVARIQRDESAMGPLGLSPDGTQVITGLRHGGAGVWDLPSGSLRASFVGHNARVDRAVFSPDGSRAWTASWTGGWLNRRNRVTRFWDTRPISREGGLLGGIECERELLPSADGRRVAIYESKTRTTSILDLEMETRIATIDGRFGAPHGSRALGAALVPISRKGNGIALWNPGTGEVKPLPRQLGGETCESALLSPLGGFVITEHKDGSVKLWRTGSNEMVAVLLAAETTNNLRYIFGPGDERLLTVESAAARSTWSEATTLLWDVQAGSVIRRLEGDSSGGVGSPFAFGPKGDWIAAKSGTALGLWSADTGELSVMIESEVAGEPVFGPNGRLLVPPSHDEGSIDAPRIYDVKVGAFVGELRGHTGNVNGAEFSPDGRYILTASEDKTARLWDVATYECLLVLGGHDSAVERAAFTPDGKKIITITIEGSLRIWHSTPYRERRPALLRNREAQEEMEPGIQAQLAGGATLDELRASITSDKQLDDAQRLAGFAILTRYRLFVRKRVIEHLGDDRPLAEVLEAVLEDPELGPHLMEEALAYARQEKAGP